MTAETLQTVTAASVITPRLLNIQQCADYLGVGVCTMRDYIALGYVNPIDLPPRRPLEGEKQRTAIRRVLIDVQDLDAFIETRKRRASNTTRSSAE